MNELPGSNRRPADSESLLTDGPNNRLTPLEYVGGITPSVPPVFIEGQEPGNVDDEHVYHRGWGIPNDRNPNPSAEGFDDQSPG